MKPEEAKEAILLSDCERWCRSLKIIPFCGKCRWGVALEALDKQIPFEPETDHLKIGVGRCKCGVEFLDKKTNYCGNCGQKLMWKEERSENESSN